MLDTTERPIADKVTETARGFRNKYRIDKRTLFRREGGQKFYREPGEYLSAYVWPSRDVAETRAAEWLRHTERSLRTQGVTCEYLGAFPVSA